ncbi:MAG: hypothetical protein GXP16_18450 [Gammaproteobacteria bacterium]|nr:hypothetical protein [Gammaproteobacteria bacterium]
MKNSFGFLTLISLIACSGSSGEKEKDTATEAFINCDFVGALAGAEEAINLAGDNIDIVVPALIIVGKSSEFLNREHSAYEKIVDLVPNNVSSVKEVEKVANNFVEALSKMSPDKVKACSELQR